MKITHYVVVALVVALAACDEDGAGGEIDAAPAADKTISPAPDRAVAADTLTDTVPALDGPTKKPDLAALDGPAAKPDLPAVDGPAPKPDLAAADGPTPTPNVVNATTLTGKVMFGYQGWFGCPGDGSTLNTWMHWFKSQTPTASSATVDFWPDVSELSAAERCATKMTLPGGKPAAVFSAYRKATVVRHFKWMK